VNTAGNERIDHTVGEYLSHGVMNLCWQEYIRDLEKEEEEEKRVLKVPFRSSCYHHLCAGIEST